MQNYAIRITHPKTHPSIIELQTLKKGRWALAEETGKETGKPHCHIWLETDKAVQTIRNRITKHVEKGNKSYSCTHIREEAKYLAYILKSDPNPQIENFTEEQIQEAKEYKEDKQKETKKKSTILKELQDGLLKFQEEGRDSELNGEENLMLYILTYHHLNNMTIRKFQVMSYFYTLYSENYYQRRTLARKWVEFL